MHGLTIMVKILKMKFDQDLCKNWWFDIKKLVITLRSVVPLTMFMKWFQFQLQYFISISTKLKLKILTKPSLKILTNIQVRNLKQTSAAKYWPNSCFKISPELQLQNLEQVWTKNLRPNLSSHICNKLLIINISNKGGNLSKFWVGIFNSSHTSEWVS